MVAKVPNPNPRRVLLWVLVISLPIALALALLGFVLVLPTEVKIEIAKRNFAALVGLPVAAIFAVFLVRGLQQTSGPVRFEGLGFKFEGASGQIVLWVLCFLAMAGAIRLLWQ